VRARDEDGAAGSVELGLELESGSDAGKGTTPTGGVPLSATSRERAGEEKAAHAGWAERGAAAQEEREERRGAEEELGWGAAHSGRGDRARGEIRAREKRRERREPAGEREGEENLGRRWPTWKEERRWARVAWARKKRRGSP
jgi:hypothetical protein